MILIFKRIFRRIISILKKLRPQKFVVANIVKLAPGDLLKGRVALITGGTSGIGKAIAEAFIDAGATVIITGRSQLRLDAVKREMLKCHPDASIMSIEMDNSKSGCIEKSFTKIVEMLNGNQLDILVNNAGISIAPSDDIKEEEDNFNKVIETNLKATYLMTKLVSQYMVANHIKGNILNIASTSSNRPVTNSYSLSKWGIKGLTLGAAKVLIKDGIVVNAIAPGPTATPMMKQDGDSNLSLPENPSGRFAMPEEIANMAVVLTSGLGRMVVGDIVFMGGGSGVITVDDIKY